MNKIDVKLLKKNLTLAHHKQIMQALNIPAFSENKEQIIYFTGDRNNVPVQIINGENKMPAGGIFLNGNTLEQIEEITEKENINLE